MNRVNFSNFLFDNRLRSYERLKSRAVIDSLFKGVESEKAYPLRLVFRRIPLAVIGDMNEDKLPTSKALTSELIPVQMGFVASKRGFKKAPDRNFIKRRMKESYRLNKKALYAWCEKEQICIQGMLIYTGRELPTQIEINKSWSKLLRRLDGDFFS